MEFEKMLTLSWFLLHPKLKTIFHIEKKEAVETIQQGETARKKGKMMDEK